MTATAGMSAARMPTARMPTAATDTAATADASTATITATIISSAAIIRTVGVTAVVEIAAAVDHPAQHAGNHPADDRFGKQVTAIIPDLLDLCARLAQLRNGHADHPSRSRRGPEHHSNANNRGNLKPIHLKILLVGCIDVMMPMLQLFQGLALLKPHPRPRRKTAR